MHFLIDAYNTIGQVFSLSEPQKEDKLIEFLQKQFDSTKDTLTVVFDNPRALLHGHHFHRSRIRVVVTHEGESADDWLIRKMTQIQTQEFSKNKIAGAVMRMRAARRARFSINCPRGCLSTFFSL